MALAAALARNTRPVVPENIISNCQQEDRVVVENILLVASETVPCANLTATTLVKANGKYKLCVPLAAPHLVTLSQLRAIQTYNPARVAEVSFKTDRAEKPDGGDGAQLSALVIEVADQATPISVSEIEVMRVCKRRRWW